MSVGAQVAPLRPSDPTAVGPYRLLGRLGAGGMGEVFLGRGGGRLAAVKVVHRALAAQERFRERFAREVATVRAIDAPWASAVIDADASGPRPWLATEYVAGPSLEHAVSSAGPLPGIEVAALAARLAGALAELHPLGVVHRDLKPSNVLLGADAPKLIDFGLARAVDDAAVTQTGLVLGTPAYMSPEQALGAEVGPASDLFSLASVLVHAATGVGPFGTASNPVAMLRRVCDQEPELAEAPEWLRLLARACLAKDPAARPTAAALAGRLARLPGAGRAPWPPPVTAARIDGLSTSGPRRLDRRALLGGLTLGAGAAVVAAVAWAAGTTSPDPFAAGPAAGRLRWKAPLGAGVDHVAVTDRVVYASAQDSAVYALDAATGRQLWTFTTRHVPRRPIPVGGTVYFDDGTYAYALDAGTGRLRWDKEFARITSASGDTPVGVIYEHNVYTAVGYDPSRGDVRWRYPFPADDSHADTPTVAADGLVHLAFDATLVTLNGATGIPLWQLLWRGGWRRRVAVTDGKVFGLADGAVAAWGARSGVELWRSPLEDGFTGGLVAADHTVYHSGGSTLTAWDANTGQARWRVPDAPVGGFASLDTVPAALDDTLYAVQRRIERSAPRVVLTARSTGTGDERWDVPLDGTDAEGGSLSFSTPMTAGGAVFFGSGPAQESTRDGAVYAVELA
ncbi:serine/threonine-protein kinase [Pseudonocardia acaciae]|uniref:serine/threonine-protein kinase n=1 Tax=Pseudonocardia acaciae TaxID=551276 RepID=UPI00068682A1|nr:serine/threonine-protein kinase [Pseudonocardia acaciae]